jgi:uncharacterized membrane protein YdbT with pleckstrin-like domain
MWTTDFAVTSKRVVVKRGWLNRRTQELAVESVEGVSVQQSIWARLFGYGRVIVTGTGDATIVFPPMAHPVAFRRNIEEARAECGAVRLAREDRDAIERAANTNEDVANDADEDVIVEEEEKPRHRRKRSFIGLR